MDSAQNTKPTFRSILQDIVCRRHADKAAARQAASAAVNLTNREVRLLVKAIEQNY